MRWRSQSAMRASLILAMLVVSVVAAGQSQSREAADPEAPRRQFSPRLGPGPTGPFEARHGMVSTSSHPATVAGVETLRAGGNAFDAAAVVQFLLAVSEPYASGIGGGMFAVLYDADQQAIVCIDGREEAPRAFDSDAFRDEDGAIIPFRQRATGGNAVGVPGTLAATAYLLERHGTLTLAEALEPAIRLARRGFIVTEPFARNLAAHWDRLQRYPASKALFGREGGGPLQAGDHFRNPHLAETFELIAEHGIAAFYDGPLAEAIVAAVRDDPHQPGVLTLDDLANYRAVRREPVAVRYRDYEVYGMNMPTSGGTTLGLMLNLLETTDFADHPWGSAASIHRLVDVQNLAFADRNRYLADADFADVPVAGLLDQDYAAKRAAMLHADRAAATPVEPGQPAGADAAQSFAPPSEGGRSTTHFSIVDRDRNVVAITSTIEQHFGSAMVVPGRGFLLNNELTDFDADARDADGQLVPNAPEGGRRPRRTALGDAAATVGGKRPRSSMSPTIVLREGEPYLALGSPGGSRIIGITANVLVNVLDHDMDVQAAVNAPRIVARNGPAELETPLHADEALRAALHDRGFEVRDAGLVGSVQVIQIGRDGWLRGAADPRRHGLVIGY